jgi:HAD superfamily hydrolase (TIGR01509 family)
MALQALIFDVDGTLANTERDAHLLAFNQAFKEFDINWFWDNDLYHELLKITGGKERIRYYIQDYLQDFVIPSEFVDLADLAVKLHKKKTDNFINIINSSNLKLRTGIKRLLKEAHAKGLRLAIATTTSFENVEAIIDNTMGRAWLDNFEVIGAGDMVKHKKPAPDIYIYVLDKMGLNPNEAIAFEDSENGILAANDAGIKSVITINEWTDTHNFTGALVVLNNLGEKDKPFTMISGTPTSYSFVNVDYLLELYAQNY